MAASDPTVTLIVMLCLAQSREARVLINKVALGVAAGAVAWVLFRSWYAAAVAFSSIAGAGLFRAYWRSVSTDA